MSDLLIVSFVYDTLNRSSSVVDVDDTLTFLDECSIPNRITECRILTELDSSRKPRLRTIMCSICYKLFSYPHKYMLSHEGRYYCISCKEDGVGKRESIRHFLSNK